MNDAPPKLNYCLLTTADEARAALSGLTEYSHLGLDTETFWDRSISSPTGVSLIQIATPANEVFVIDALATGVEIVRAVVESKDTAKVAHNARFDEGVLRGAGLAPDNFIDTLQLARFALDLPSFSLKSVVAHLFQVELDKSFQKSNWRRRPLSDEQLEYAALDAVLTLRLFTELKTILEADNRWELASKVATLRARTGESGKPKRQAIKPTPLVLTTEERRLVARLKEWRSERARQLRVPAYMVFPDRTLEHLAQRKPDNLESLKDVYGLGEAKINRFGAELLQALRMLEEEEDLS